MNIAAIMPCRGRAEQTVTNVRRLLATAGMDHGCEWYFYLTAGREDSGMIAEIASQIAGETGASIGLMSSRESRLSYWQALVVATRVSDAPLLVNLANDLLPGQHWLKRAVDAYRETFGDGDGMIGFNDGHHEVGHSCHFLISRALLNHYGGWPVWYDHNYGDTELCQRAIADGVYAKAPWAVLYHDHPYFGGADDAVYAEGRAQMERDRQLYEQRRRAGWPAPKR